MAGIEAVSLPEELASRAEADLSAQAILAGLDAGQRRVCILLLQGYSRAEIRQRLHLKQKALRDSIDHIRRLYLQGQGRSI